MKLKFLNACYFKSTPYLIQGKNLGFLNVAHIKGTNGSYVTFNKAQYFFTFQNQKGEQITLDLYSPIKSALSILGKKKLSKKLGTRSKRP